MGRLGTLHLWRAAPSLDRGLYIGPGEILGIDLDGRPIMFDDAIVVIELVHVGSGWLVTYRALGAQASGAVNSRMRPVAS